MQKEKNLQYIVEETTDQFLNGWLPTPIDHTVAASREYVEMEYKGISDAELGWIEPINGIGFYLVCDMNRVTCIKEITNAHTLLKMLLEKIYKSEPNGNLEYKPTFECTATFSEMDGTTYIDIQVKIADFILHQDGVPLGN